MLAFKLALAVSVRQTPAHSPPRSLAIWLRQTHPPLAQVDRRRLLHRPRSAALTRCRRGQGPSWGRGTCKGFAQVGDASIPVQ
jgi:hypothetical protein